MLTRRQLRPSPKRGVIRGRAHRRPGQGGAARGLSDAEDGSDTVGARPFAGALWRRVARGSRWPMSVWMLAFPSAVAERFRYLCQGDQVAAVISRRDRARERPGDPMVRFGEVGGQTQLTVVRRGVEKAADVATRARPDSPGFRER